MMSSWSFPGDFLCEDAGACQTDYFVFSSDSVGIGRNGCRDDESSLVGRAIWGEGS